MRLLVRNYLLDHTLEQLELDHGICARLSSDGAKVSLNYDQILAKNSDPVASQCRGLVVRPWTRLPDGDAAKRTVVGGLDVCAWPMDRFFNAGDTAAAVVDWSDPDLRVMDKVDGTCCILYFDTVKLEWCVATRSVPEADLAITPPDDVNTSSLPWELIDNLTFYTLFKWAAEKTTGEPWAAWTARLDRENTYVFELTTPWNRVFIPYDVSRITLLAVRVTSAGVELRPEKFAAALNVPLPASLTLRDVGELAAFVNMQDPTRCEGAVVCDSRFNRQKVKNQQYVMSSKMKDALRVSRYAVLEQILLDKGDDLIAALDPELGAKLQAMIDGLHTYCREVDERFAALRTLPSRKDFALAVKDTVWPAIYFGLWEGRASNALSWLKSNAAAGKVTRRALDVILDQIGG